MKTCDWCDERATYATEQDGAACEAHRDDLIRVARDRIWRSGDPFAGEAAEALVLSMREVSRA